MNVVEAIDTWIDERIDDFSDDELERILEMLDVVSASEIADLQTELVYNDDIFALVTLVGGTTNDQHFTEDILRAAFFGDPLPGDLYPADALLPLTDVDVNEPVAVDDLTPDDDPSPDGDASPADDVVLPEDDAQESAEQDDDAALLGGASALVEDPTPDDEQLAEIEIADEEPEKELASQDLAEASELDASEIDASELDDAAHDDFLSDLQRATTTEAPDELADTAHDDFLSDLQKATETTTDTATTEAATSASSFNKVPLVEFRPGDELGPSFLPDTPAKRSKRSNTAGQWFVTAFLIAGLALFAFGSVQLFNSLNAEPEETTTTAAAPGTETSTATAAPDEAPSAPTDTPDQAASDNPSDPASSETPAPATAPVAEPSARIGIRLTTGEVVLVDPTLPAEFKVVYPPANAEDFAPARSFTWVDDLIGIVDENGNVLTLNPELQQPPTLLVYGVGDGLDPAREIAKVGDQFAVNTNAGDIVLIPDSGNPDADNLEFLWDAAEEEVAAIDIASVGELVPFVLEDGTAQVIDTANNNDARELWDTEDQEPASSVTASTSGILLGVGEGSVVRFALDGDAGSFGSVWDPDEDEPPAIAYSSTGDRTAIALSDGAIILPNDRGFGPRLWDPEQTEIRALTLSSNADHITALLESGTVVRISVSSDEIISVWDVTDVTLPPAAQIQIETLPDNE